MGEGNSNKNKFDEEQDEGSDFVEDRKDEGESGKKEINNELC